MKNNFVNLYELTLLYIKSNYRLRRCRSSVDLPPSGKRSQQCLLPICRGDLIPQLDFWTHDFFKLTTYPISFETKRATNKTNLYQDEKLFLQQKSSQNFLLSSARLENRNDFKIWEFGNAGASCLKQLNLEFALAMQAASKTRIPAQPKSKF